MRLTRPVAGLVLVLSAAACQAGGAARFRLAAIPAGATWVGWNESGAYELDLPPDWSYTVTSEHPTKALLADDRVVDLPDGVRLQAVGPVRLRARATCLRGRFRHGQWEVEVPAGRLNFAAGAQFSGPSSLCGSAGRVELLALSWSTAPTLEVEYRGELRASFDRLQWQCPDREVARVTELLAPGFTGGLLPEVNSLGVWSTGRIVLRCGRDEAWLATDQVGWWQVNGQTIRTGPPQLDAPRAEIRVRQSTFRRRALVKLPCLVREPTGLLAEHLQLDTTGAPELLMLDAAFSPEALTRALEELAAARRRAAGWTVDLLTDSIRDYLLPLWFGLWYDSDLGAETVREPPTWRAFTEAWEQAEATTTARAVEWLSEQEPQVLAVSAAKPETLAEALTAMVKSQTGDDAKAGVWWSVWLSDQLSAAGGGPVGYWYASSTAAVAAPEPGELTLQVLHDRLLKREPGEVLAALGEYVTLHPVVASVVLPRLAPNATQPVTLVADAGRRTPVGRYEAEVRLQADGAEPASVPLTVVVLPSLGSQALVALAWLLPLALAAGVLLGTARRTGRGRREAGRLQLALQRRFSAWNEFLEQYGEGPEESPERSAEGIRAFAEAGLLELLNHELYGEYAAVREAEGVGLEAFLRNVRQHLRRLAESTGGV